MASLAEMLARHDKTHIPYKHSDAELPDSLVKTLSEDNIDFVCITGNSVSHAARLHINTLDFPSAHLK